MRFVICTMFALAVSSIFGVSAVAEDVAKNPLTDEWIQLRERFAGAWQYHGSAGGEQLTGLWIARLFSESYVNNVFAQIGLVMLIGLAAKNAILIVEFAKVESEKGKDPVEAAMEAARLRFRPILMTAFSFILGVLPLLVASGAGAEARKVMGMTVFSGMLVATVIGVLVVPALYVMVERYIARPKPQPAAAGTNTPEPVEDA